MTLAGEVGELLRSKGLTLSVSESCTGGKVGDLITDVPGSSDYFLGGVVSYSNQAKMDLLRVDPATLERKGAVSEEVALQMASGVRAALKSDVGIGITGIAGPTGGTTTKPVGLVYIAVSSAVRAVCRRTLFNGSREEVKSRAAKEALSILKDFLLQH